ncbi:hypothetical protein P4N68_00320 [Corynebacterium felinum]|uniref:DUF2567 domain-containing protein n=1 Tax=Corynebacterium felinum TaxID=131318 RepID=A0ABU2BFE3_9CORY|nr:hypothetical protein [Corynebacterium felinum]MDF5819528.1 hypothetical protein [Corynebacterium felinum]MDR7356089.1 hypothetical protein [Corynebacterium felinum]WJY95423.1 hypothetical protein CFELI_09095 [Corynebacterium felinum]
MQRISPKVGAFARVVVIFCISYALAGGVWAWLRPHYTATVINDAQVELSHTPSVEFANHFWLLGGCIVLALILAGRMYSRTYEYRGIAMMLWCGVWAAVGSGVFIAVGLWVTPLIHNVVSIDNAVVGQEYFYVPALDVHPVVFVVPALVAMSRYWLAEFIYGDILGPSDGAVAGDFGTDVVDSVEDVVDRKLEVEH